jgi:glycosyltransferase involved in cell wall biosynthesis
MTSSDTKIQIVTTTTSGPYPSTGLGLPVVRLRALSELLGPNLVARRLSRRVERWVDPQKILGLDKAISDSDVVCVNETHLASSAQVCLLKKRRSSLRVCVVCYENIPFRYEDDRLLAERKDRVRELADCFIAVTPQAHDALTTEGVASNRVVLQPYGVDCREFTPELRDARLRQNWGARPHDCVVLYAGRLIQEKGIANLLRACAPLGDRNLRIVFVGEGAERPRLVRIAEQLGLEGVVTFLPWAARHEMPRIMASADVFAMPSLPTPYWEEQLGFSLLEAMASSLPILSTRSGSIEFVVDDAGLLVSPYEVGSLSDALDRLARDPRYRTMLGIAGRRRVESELNTSVVADRLRLLLCGT